MGSLVAGALAFAACGSSNDDQLLGLAVSPQQQQGVLPDGGIAGGEFGPNVCPSAEIECNGACINPSGDVNNCGACGVTCSGTCALGRCIVQLAPGDGAGAGNARAALAVTSTSVYYFGAGGLMSVPIGGGTPATIAPGGSGAIATDAKNVYYFGPGGLMSVPLAGGTPVTLAPGSGYGITVNSYGVCWTSVSGEVLSVPLDGIGDGGSPTVLAEGQGYADGIVATNTHVYWTDNGMLSSAGGFAPLSGTVQALALTPPPASTDGGTPDDGGTSDDAGTVDAGDAGPLKTIASAQNYPVEVTVDPTSVYWTASGTVANAFNDGALMKAPIGGGAATPLASAQPTPFGIAVDATNVYWTNNDNAGTSGTVMSIPVGGGTPVTLAAGQSSPWYVAVDSTSVYWTTGSGSVMKLSPK